MSEFKSNQFFKLMEDGFKNLSDNEKADMKKKTNGVFEFHVKNAGGKELVETIDLKREGAV